VACANHWLEEPSRVWGIPPPHENDWLSRPDRQALWGAGDDAQLEHNTFSVTDCEIPRARHVDRRSLERGPATIDGGAFTGEGRLIRKATGFEQKKLKPRSPAFGFAGRASRDSGPPFTRIKEPQIPLKRLYSHDR